MMERVNTKDDGGFRCLTAPIYAVFSFYPAFLESCKAAATLMFIAVSCRVLFIRL